MLRRLSMVSSDVVHTAESESCLILAGWSLKRVVSRCTNTLSLQVHQARFGQFADEVEEEIRELDEQNDLPVPGETFWIHLY